MSRRRSWSRWPACRGTAYQGHVLVCETAVTTPELRDRLIGASADALRRLLREQGVEGLRHAALRQVRAGVTSLEEAIQRTSQDPG